MQRLLAPLLLFLALTSCAHVDASGELSYAPSAEENYERGVTARERGRHIDAIKFFEHVRFKFPYSTYAALADLAIADTEFEQERYLEAVEGYQSFVRMHPSHPQADYAEFRAALSYYRDIPSSFFLFPPSPEKDQGSVRNAYSTLARFLRDHPGSRYAPEARQLLKDARERLAKHELAVAKFYLHHDRPKATVARVERLLRDYSDTPVDCEALLLLAKAHLEQKEPDAARAALERIVEEHPNDPLVPDAKAMLGALE